MTKKLKDLTIEDLVKTCDEHIGNCNECPLRCVHICFLRWRNFKDALNKEINI